MQLLRVFTVLAVLFTNSQAWATVQNQLTFTLDPTWTAEEQANITTWWDDFYPQLLAKKGPPAQSGVVHIVKTPGESPSLSRLVCGQTGEMRIPVADTPAVSHLLAHEMGHAWNGCHIMLSADEEWFNRAVEVDVIDLAGHCQFYYNCRHQYTIDIYTNVLNTIGLAATNGNLFAGAVFVLTRYNVGGYLIWKIGKERPGFFKKFFQSLYAAARLNPAVTQDAQAIYDLARKAVRIKKFKGGKWVWVDGTVEGKSFPIWYAKQPIFNLAPSIGYQTVFKPDSSTFYVYERLASGLENNLEVLVVWNATDAYGNTLGSNQTLTNTNGWIDASIANPGYDTSIRYNFTSYMPDGSVMTREVYSSTAQPQGAFGVVKDHTDGEVTVRAPDGTVYTVPVAYGAFSVPWVEGIAGKFRVTYTGDGVSITRIVTKDAAPCYVQM